MFFGDPLFLNKVAGAILAPALFAMVCGVVASAAYNPHIPESPHYAIGGGEVVKTANTAAAAAPSGPEPILALLASADAGAGAKVFKKCGSCHNADKDGKHKLGPNLWNIVGGPKASKEGFTKYSGALSGLGGDWDFESLNKFLYKPKEFVKGTGMAFAGLKKVEDRANVILFLHSKSDAPIPLPN